MRRLRYSVAATLDGFIADPNGGYDWIVMDDAIDLMGGLKGGSDGAIRTRDAGDGLFCLSTIDHLPTFFQSSDLPVF